MVKWKGLGVGDNTVEKMDCFVDLEEGVPLPDGATVSGALLAYARDHSDVSDELKRRGWIT